MVKKRNEYFRGKKFFIISNMPKNDQLINQPNDVSYLIPSLLPPGEKFCVVNDHGGAEILVLSEGKKCLFCCNSWSVETM